MGALFIPSNWKLMCRILLLSSSSPFFIFSSLHLLLFIFISVFGSQSVGIVNNFWSGYPISTKLETTR
ncbi:L-sorbosone dehydrogenase [Fusarium oxysporum f. sp. albedinis]|nr:L-sorbosone dehydrogenase [Fusarium oxysporum f. sp. albedinis]